jgi:hypothetical protein
MHRHGQGLYDDWRQEGESSFIDIYHDIWRFVFAPSPPIADILKKEMDRMQLEPGNYVMAHVRALYAVHSREDNFVQDMTRNAVQCALTLIPRLQSSLTQKELPEISVSFASDSALAVETALEYGNGTVVSATKSDDKPPLHLDRANSTDPRDYYNIFVDLLLLGNSRCATFNIGGFGRWGALIAYPLTYDHSRTQIGNMDNDNDFEATCWIEHHRHDCLKETL